MGFALCERMWEMALVQAARGKEEAPARLGTCGLRDRRGAGVGCGDRISQGFYYFTSVSKSLAPFKYKRTGEEIPLLTSLCRCFFGQVGCTR